MSFHLNLIWNLFFLFLGFCLFLIYLFLACKLNLKDSYFKTCIYAESWSYKAKTQSWLEHEALPISVRLLSKKKHDKEINLPLLMILDDWPNSTIFFLKLLFLKCGSADLQSYKYFLSWSVPRETLKKYHFNLLSIIHSRRATAASPYNLRSLQSGKTNHLESRYFSPWLQHISKLRQTCLNDREIQLQD